MENLLNISLSKRESLLIIECLDNEIAQWIEVAKNAKDEDVKIDYEHDITDLKELIQKFKSQAEKTYGKEIVKFAHYPRGISL